MFCITNRVQTFFWKQRFINQFGAEIWTSISVSLNLAFKIVLKCVTNLLQCIIWIQYFGFSLERIFFFLNISLLLFKRYCPIFLGNQNSEEEIAYCAFFLLDSAFWKEHLLNISNFSFFEVFNYHGADKSGQDIRKNEVDTISYTISQGSYSHKELEFLNVFK